MNAILSLRRAFPGYLGLFSGSRCCFWFLVDLGAVQDGCVHDCVGRNPHFFGLPFGGLGNVERPCAWVGFVTNAVFKGH
jgi:hypothetical protein